MNLDSRGATAELLERRARRQAIPPSAIERV